MTYPPPGDPYGAPTPPQQPYGGAPQPYGSQTPPQQPYGAPTPPPYGAPQPQYGANTPPPYGAPPLPYGAAPGYDNPYGAAPARRVVALVADGYNSDEIASMLGSSPAVIRSNLSHARKRLRRVAA